MGFQQYVLRLMGADETFAKRAEMGSKRIPRATQRRTSHHHHRETLIIDAAGPRPEGQRATFQSLFKYVT